MEKRIYRSLCILSLAAALLCSLLIFWVMEVNAAAQMRQSTQESAAALADVMNAGSVDISALGVQQSAGENTLRLTLIAPDGSVLYDSTGLALENHADRPEFKAALQTGAGESERLSATLQKRTFYCALRLASGDVLRVSTTTASMWARLLSCVPFLLLVVCVVGVGGVFAAGGLTKRLVAPLNDVDPEHPLDCDTYDEVTPLLLRIDRQNKQLEKQVEAEQAMRDDLAGIMENMTEGLVVLDSAAHILSVNAAALRALGEEGRACVGKPLLALERSEEFLRLSDAAKAHTALQTQLVRAQRTYSISLSPAPRGGSILLLVDITERAAAEQMRREFSANVSHELKTPLQALLGYAELLRGGMVAEADKPSFYDNIYKESRRLITLVQDIIDLSRLDEGGTQLARERTDLTALAESAAAQLAAKAAEKQVTLRVEADAAPVYVTGVPRLLSELVFNLADNAVSYNRPGGSVVLRVRAGDAADVQAQAANAAQPGAAGAAQTVPGLQPAAAQTVAAQSAETAALGAGTLILPGEAAAAHGPLLCVQDTGIGIPPEHRERIFERFYRVDKSHSRATGGTGLGLSIVKHAAALHGARLTLQSAEGKGTAVTVRFPAPGPEAPAAE